MSQNSSCVQFHFYPRFFPGTLPLHSQTLLQRLTLSILVCVQSHGCLLRAIATSCHLKKKAGQKLLQPVLYWVWDTVLQGILLWLQGFKSLAHFTYTEQKCKCNVSSLGPMFHDMENKRSTNFSTLTKICAVIYAALANAESIVYYNPLTDFPHKL